ncbi:hypothetical protein [Streptomyces chryseus]|uniref:hypothetical protein n=1 Tax=Streptomyces chryseus TaxID=68186 RepID=UPI00110FCEC8|nr:hypothetical protein [Streptomyces chryseus]GGX26858.1 hypothetical protein GCM10010353_47500 [Streptomyces chryseus]
MGGSSVKVYLVAAVAALIAVVLVVGCRAGIDEGAQAPGIGLDIDAPKKHRTSKQKAPAFKAPAPAKAPTFRKR